MGLSDVVQEWLFSVALKKGVISLVKVVIAFVTSVKVAPILSQLGISIDQTVLVGGLTSILTGLLTMAKNWLKMKYNITWL